MTAASEPTRAGDILLDALADRIADRVVARLPQPIERQSYTIDEAASALGVSRSTVERAIAAGQLQAQRVGTRRTITVHEVRRFSRVGGEL